MPMKEGMELLADTKYDYGKRIGPALARKIYLMLTSTSGTEIIDENWLLFRRLKKNKNISYESKHNSEQMIWHWQQAPWEHN